MARFGLRSTFDRPAGQRQQPAPNAIYFRAELVSGLALAWGLASSMEAVLESISGPEVRSSAKFLTASIAKTLFKSSQLSCCMHFLENLVNYSIYLSAIPCRSALVCY